MRQIGPRDIPVGFWVIPIGTQDLSEVDLPLLPPRRIGDEIPFFHFVNKPVHLPGINGDRARLCVGKHFELFGF